MGVRTTDDRLAEPPTTRGRTRTIALWALQLLLAFQFAGGGGLKLSGAPVMVEMFAMIGAGQWFRILVGALEVAAAVGLLIPRLTGFAALGLCGLMVGATLTNLLILNADPWAALVLLLLSAIVAWSRRSQMAVLLHLGAGGGRR